MKAKKKLFQNTSRRVSKELPWNRGFWNLENPLIRQQKSKKSSLCRVSNNKSNIIVFTGSIFFRPFLKYSEDFLYYNDFLCIFEMIRLWSCFLYLKAWKLSKTLVLESTEHVRERGGVPILKKSENRSLIVYTYLIFIILNFKFSWINYLSAPSNCKDMRIQN